MDPGFLSSMQCQATLRGWVVYEQLCLQDAPFSLLEARAPALCEEEVAAVGTGSRSCWTL